MNFIDRFLNSITMYRLMFWYLLILLGVAAIFSATGILPYSPIEIILSTIFLLFVCGVTNDFIAHVMKVPTNTDSANITALILALIITPAITGSSLIFMAWAGVLAMASKYIVAIDKKHIFNPAAFGVGVTLLAFNQSASWWIGGNLPLMAFLIVGGLLILRKIRRFDLGITFFVAALASDVLTHAAFNPWTTIQQALLHTPIFFFGTVMITEPLTTPPTRARRIAYAAIVGALFSPFIVIAGIVSTPELALLIGNIFSFIVSPKGKQVLTLKEKKKVSDDLYHFTFSPEKRLKFRPGQYLEWTLAHKKTDGRGNRRYFTIASAPTEDTVQLGVKFYEPSSTFKEALGTMAPGETIVAGQLAGDFTLPKDPSKKLAFIAGGIGITPFRSMIKDLIDRREKRDIILFYSNRTASEAAYREVFDDAERALGIRVFYISTDTGRRLDGEMLETAVPDHRDRIFYISGTHSMTNEFRRTLRGMGVPAAHIRTDFFPGFA